MPAPFASLVVDRRSFLAAGLAVVLPRGAQPRPAKTPAHPDPRPGVDASHVLTRAQLVGEDAEVIEAFDLAREIPQVLDGIRCHCGCADSPGYRSLLSCFEGEAMARHCAICQGQARLAHEMHEAGRALGAIRAAVDRRFS